VCGGCVCVCVGDVGDVVGGRWRGCVWKMRSVCVWCVSDVCGGCGGCVC